MGDLKSFWTDAGAPTPEASGAGVTSRGGDPLINTGGSSGLQDLWSGAPVPNPAGMESGNSVSGLPSTPARFEPSGTPPEPPSLQDRNPGTIDQR